MHERLALEIRVDERAYDTYLGEAQPSGNVLGLVLKEQSHGVAFLESEPFHEQVGNLVAVVLDLLITVTNLVSLEAQTVDSEVSVHDSPLGRSMFGLRTRCMAYRDVCELAFGIRRQLLHFVARICSSGLRS